MPMVPGRKAQKLTASDGSAHDEFGASVSIHEDFLVIGAPSNGDNDVLVGSAYIFARQANGT